MEKKRNVLIINICARNDLNFTVSRSFIPKKVVKRSMGFKRPLVQIQSLGPNKQGYLLVPLFVCFGYLVRTPAASCISINGRKAAVAASIAAAAAGSNPVTRTKNAEIIEISAFFLFLFPFQGTLDF
ncbi:MAG: hypothetical protein IKO00_07920 [Oscillospiraceae bacterium]|nr:hypothetical protein [Oscillospiraceae bacterium]